MPNITSKRLIVEVLIALALLCGIAYAFIRFDLFDRWYAFTRAYEDWELDEVFAIFVAALITGMYLAFRYVLYFKNRSFRHEKGKKKTKSDYKNTIGLPLTPLYVLGLSIIGFLLILFFFIADNAISQQAYDARIINTSGKQRMLSQRIALTTAQLVFPEKREWAKKELRRAGDEMYKNHKFLTREEISHNEPGGHSDKIHNMYFEKNIIYGKKEQKRLTNLDSLILHYLEEVDEVLTLNDADMTLDNSLMNHAINDYHDTLLPLLDAVVNQYENESSGKVLELQSMEKAILYITLCVLLLEGLFIFRPMVRRVERQAYELQKTKNSEKMAALGGMASGLAHEINNALQPVLGLNEILQRRLKDSEDPQIMKHLKTIEKSALHARTIVENVLEFSRQSQNSGFENYDSKTILGEAIDFARTLLPSSVPVEINLSAGLANMTGYIHGNKTSIVQVFINIFKNASDAMDHKGQITLNFEQRLPTQEEMNNIGLSKQNYVIIRISDEGPGIGDKDIDQIFDPFFTTKEEGEGTGLGLSTVYGIMQQHHGTIIVDSEIDEGTTFSLFFPVTN